MSQVPSHLQLSRALPRASSPSTVADLAAAREALGLLFRSSPHLSEGLTFKQLLKTESNLLKWDQ